MQVDNEPLSILHVQYMVYVPTCTYCIHTHVLLYHIILMAYALFRGNRYLFDDCALCRLSAVLSHLELSSSIRGLFATDCVHSRYLHPWAVVYDGLKYLCQWYKAQKQRSKVG